MPLFMRCSEISGECPETPNEYYIWYKSQVQTCLKGFWIFDISGIIDLGTKVYAKWVEEAVYQAVVTKPFHF